MITIVITGCSAVATGSPVLALLGTTSTVSNERFAAKPVIDASAA